MIDAIRKFFLPPVSSVNSPSRVDMIKTRSPRIPVKCIVIRFRMIRIVIDIFL